MTTRRVAMASGLAALSAAAQRAPATPEQIVMLVYPGMTALDLVGPQQVFGYLMGARVHLVWKTKEPVVSDTGLAIVPAMTFTEAPAAPDILFVPGGGRETIAPMDDEAVLGDDPNAISASYGSDDDGLPCADEHDLAQLRRGQAIRATIHSRPADYAYWLADVRPAGQTRK